MIMSSQTANISCTCATSVDSTKRFMANDCVSGTKALVCELCRHFYGLGWVTGTGGSVTIKVHDDKVPKSDQLIVMSPSGVQKERMMLEDMYVLASCGSVLSTPHPKQYPHCSPRYSECTPLFLKVYEMFDAGAVIHSHAIESCLVTMIQPCRKELRLTHMEMIKEIKGHGYHDELVIPIIENTAREGELIESLTEAIISYPKSSALLVRNHGVYVWGETWISAKTQAECYHYLFDAVVKLYQLGIDWSTPDHGPLVTSNRVPGFLGNFRTCIRAGALDSDDTVAIPQRCILLGVEGTTTPVSVVSDVLSTFPHYKLVKHSPHNGLQSQCATVFDDVPNALKRWHASGIKVYIFSRCSREAQRLLFSSSNYGDLRKYLSGYFDTSFGSKNATRTYAEILLTVGANRPADVLYVTDKLEEAFAARAAGLEVMLSIRPGNEPLTEDHGFTTVESLSEAC